MKKIVLMVAVMMIAAPAMADINFAVTDNTDGSFTISYTTDGEADRPRGVAIKVTVDGYNITGSNTQMSAFNANIDYLYTNGGGLGAGHALAKETTAGEFGFDENIAVISAGVLDTGGNQGKGPASGDLITIETSMIAGDSTTVTLTADGLRGPSTGVVGSVIESNLDDTDPAVTNVPITFPVTVCLKTSDPGYVYWVASGGLEGDLDCWCYRKQCRGDGNGFVTGPFPVGVPDLTGFRTAYNKMEFEHIEGPPNSRCYDLDHLPVGPFRCGVPDLTIFRTWYNVMDIPPGTVPDCAMDHINFWMN